MDTIFFWFPSFVIFYKQDAIGVHSGESIQRVDLKPIHLIHWKKKVVYLRWSKCQFKQLVRGVVVWLSSCGLVCLYTTKYNLMQVFLGLVELTNISLIKQLLVSNFVVVPKLGFAVLLREILYLLHTFEYIIKHYVCYV